jgi:rhodanese-related sulfurtransferase
MGLGAHLAEPKLLMNAIIVTEHLTFGNFTMIENRSPQESWDILQNDATAVLIDVRTKMEHLFVGHPPKAIHIPWKEAPDFQLNAHFVESVRRVAPNPNTPILLLCRSGQRSLEAAVALENTGYLRLINIVDGFEGALDHNKQRGHLNGWRFLGLPWQQS